MAFKLSSRSILLVFVLECILCDLALGLYFHIGETERKCFIEEIPDETTVVGTYKVELYDPRTKGFMPSNPGVGMHVEVRDPDDRPILSKVYSAEGRFSFVSHDPGEHVICLYSNSTKWFSGSQLRVHLDIQVGEHAIDYAQIAQKEKLSELQLRLRQLMDQVEQITKEQNYQRYREERFRQTSESTNQRVLWWSISQVAILLIVGFWQMRHLKSFFQAKKLKTGELKEGKRFSRLTKDALVQLFSPLVTTQRVMGLHLRNPYTYVKCPGSVGLAFEELFNCTIICVGDESEDDLKRKATVTRNILEFLFGPSFETLRKEYQVTEILESMLNTWDELRNSFVGFLIEAMERCQITPAANRVVVDVLHKALKSLGENAPLSVKPNHAILLTGAKLVALYSRKGEEDLCASDMLLTTLLVTAHRRRPDIDKDAPMARIVMLHDAICGERSVPRFVYACPVFGEVILVTICETKKDELASNVVSTLRALDAVLKTKVIAPAFDLGAEVEKILLLAKKLGTPSPELVRFQRNLAAQWETAKKNGFDAFTRDYCAACVLRTKQSGSKEQSPQSQERESSQASLKNRLVKYESLLAVIVHTLQECFGLCCLDDHELQDGVDSLQEFVARKARLQLGDFADFLCVKASLNIDLVAFLEEFPSLVHFVFVDRRSNQAICPGHGSENAYGCSAFPWAKIENAVTLVRTHLSRGNHTIIWRDKSYVYSYHLWFENVSGDALLPRRESKNFASLLPYPGVIGVNFFSVLARESFSTSRASVPSHSASSATPASSIRAPRVIVKELYCWFVSSGSTGLFADQVIAQAQKVSECLPNLLTPSATTVDFL
ncbi:unnamed protein product [Notodromas monacha]|uniref:GOLD domain-containing protein n=1 Tax=Notodromas monacha TaxID=399045 RepID=A0A7R9BSQ3_9CRUS|nr:unnamed protein product [Notodromas monacha]CAG0919656.1 unnamed protein product [Notodromas monacha]